VTESEVLLVQGSSSISGRCKNEFHWSQMSHIKRFYLRQQLWDWWKEWKIHNIHTHLLLLLLLMLLQLFTRARLASMGIICHRVSVCVPVCHTPVLWQNG